MTPPTELVARLRAGRVVLKSGEYDGADLMQAWCAMTEAADTIEAMAGEIASMKRRLDLWEPKITTGHAGSSWTNDTGVRCNKVLAGLAKPYPRTCMVCGKGPCRDDVVAYQAAVSAVNTATDDDLARSALATPKEGS